MKDISLMNWLEDRFKMKWAAFAVISAGAIISYCNSFTVPFILDDFGSIVNNHAIQRLFDFAALWRFYANRIVLYFTLSVNYFIHQDAVAGYHVTNLAIHILNGFLLFLLLRILLNLEVFRGKLFSRYVNTISVIAAVLFVCHPIQVNAVTYIVQRTASLAATFYFLAVLFYIKYRIQNKTCFFVLTMFFTITAMFTKENTITIPFMLIIIELFFFLKDGKTSWLKRILIFGLLLLTVPVIPFTNLFLHGYSQSDPGVAFKASTSMDRFQYFYTELNVVILYIRLMFLPDRQNFDYSNDFPVSHTIWDNNSYISLMILLITGVFSIYTIKRNRLVSFGIIWFYTGLAVESTFISIKDVYFEQRLYFPCAGFIIFIIGMVFYKSKKIHGYIKNRYLFRKPLIAFLALSFILYIAYTGFTLRRNYIYSDNIRLWSDVVGKAPGSDRAHSVLATGYLNAYDAKKGNTGYLDLAETEFKKAIDINYYNSTAHCNLSKVYLLQGKYDMCIDEAKKTLDMAKSEYADYNMGSAYKKLGKIKEALEAFLEGYRTNNRSTFLLLDLGYTCYELKDYENAGIYYEKYIENSKYNTSAIKAKIEEINKLKKINIPNPVTG